MNWFLPAIAAALVWGLGQTLIKKGLSSVSPFFSNTLAVTFALIIEIPFALSGKINLSHFPIIFLLGLLANLPTFIIPYVIEKTDVSLSGTILASYPIYTILLSVMFLKEKLGVLQVFGVMGIILGMFLVTRVKSNKRIISKWLSMAILGSVILGVGYFISKFSITRYGLYTYIFVAALSNIPCLLFTRLLDRSHRHSGFNIRIFVISLTGNFLMPLGVLLLYIAMNNGPASLISPIISIYPAITVVLAHYYLKEKIANINIYGILAVILGVVVLAI